MGKTGDRAVVNAENEKAAGVGSPSSPAFIKWQDDLYDIKKDELLRKGYSNPNAVMGGRRVRI